MQAYSELVALHAKKNFSPFEQGRNPQRVQSDVGDIFHAVYMPYVDIIRIDGFAAQYMRPLAEKWSTRVVTNRSTLVQAINDVARPST